MSKLTNYCKILNFLNISDENFRLLNGDQRSVLLNNLPIFPVGKKRENIGLTVCFTGFSDSDKNFLIQLATNNELTIKDSVVRGLAFLVTGESPGPAKMQKAIIEESTILTGTQFIKMLETGELPESKLLR